MNRGSEWAGRFQGREQRRQDLEIEGMKNPMACAPDGGELAVPIAKVDGRHAVWRELARTSDVLTCDASANRVA